MKISTGYMAGYFDGEGCIGIYRNKGSACSRYKSGHKPASWVRHVGITNTYWPLLNKFKKLFGGRLYELKGAGRNKPCYSWILGAKDEIVNFLGFLYPCLVEKKEQALVMIAECRGKESTWRAAVNLKTLKEEKHVA